MFLTLSLQYTYAFQKHKHREHQLRARNKNPVEFDQMGDIFFTFFVHKNMAMKEFSELENIIRVLEVNISSGISLMLVTAKTTSNFP